jgi:phosphoribosylformylglycinamidine synthase
MKNDSTSAASASPCAPPPGDPHGDHPDARKAISSDFKETGDLIYLLGESNGELGGSAYEAAWLKERGAAAGFRTDGRSVYGPGPHAKPRHRPGTVDVALPGLPPPLGGRLLRSAHDLSEGGLAVALAESCLGGRLGARISIQGLPGKPRPGISPLAAATRALFGESPARFLVTVRPADRERLEASLTGLPFRASAR